MTRKVDYEPLVQTLTRSERARYKARSMDARAIWRNSGEAIAATHLSWAVALGIAALLPAATFTAISLGHPNAADLTIGILSMALAAALIVGAGSRIVKMYRLRAPDWKTWARLDGFARANGLEFSPIDTSPSFPGAIFTAGDYGRAFNVVHSIAEREHTFGNHRFSSADRVLSIGNYEYTIATEHDAQTFDWGFMALRLVRRLPHIVLDAKANNHLRRTNLPMLFHKGQVLSLEGDFDKYFTLYCPKEYERDALYVFTPDLMALLIDKASPFDVEIVDDWMFVYSAKPFESTDPAVYERLLHIAHTVGTKALSQTRRYSDERGLGFSMNEVSRQGRKLWGQRILPWKLELSLLALASPQITSGILGGLIFAVVYLVYRIVPT